MHITDGAQNRFFTFSMFTGGKALEPKKQNKETRRLIMEGNTFSLAWLEVTAITLEPAKYPARYVFMMIWKCFLLLRKGR